jgi:uncharacterized repeat protein (TIGR01451 family)
MTNKILITAFATALLVLPFLFATPVSAAVRCETQYGGGQTCVKTGAIQINKQVCDPDKGTCSLGSEGLSGRFVDNLGLNSHKFSVGETVTFRLSVKNVGDATFDWVDVTDTLPSQFKLVEGNATQRLTNLTAGQTQDLFLKAEVVSTDSVSCVSNTAKAMTNDNQSDTDMSQVCLQGAAKALPQSGPEDFYIMPLLSLIAGTSGLYLLRFAKNLSN